MKTRAHRRDQIASVVSEVRRGNLRALFPNELDFSIDFEGTPVANFIDVVAHDMADGIAPLPSLACVSGRMQTDADQKRAEVKNRIGDFYWRMSKLETQMLKAADRYVSYGFACFFVEPNVKSKLPMIRLEDPRHTYYELDRFGDVHVAATNWKESVDDLCAKWPEWASDIRMDQNGRQRSGEDSLEVVRWVDGTNVTLLIPDCYGLVLGSYAHRLSKPPIVIAERPGDDDTPRGQFDDAVWIQVARAIVATLQLEAASIAVQAPIAVDSSTDEIALGPHAIIQSDNPQNIRRLSLDVPSTIFAQNQQLDSELKTGTRYPDARTGDLGGASVITGKGVEALLGSFDAQIKTAQLVFKEALQSATSLCFELDEVWWPNETKTVNGTLSGTSYEFTYTPNRDINGRYACTVTYGFAAGMQPSQSIIVLLQLEGAGLISKATLQENLPVDIDHVQEQKRIDIEGWRDSLKQGVFSYLQASGQIAAQGGDPSDIFGMAVTVIRKLQNGEQVEQAVEEAYQAIEQAKQEQQQAMAAAQAA